MFGAVAVSGWAGWNRTFVFVTLTSSASLMLVAKPLEFPTTHSFQLRRFALRFIHSRSGATGVCLPICLVVYFRCGVKLTGTSSKIDVRRLKVGDLLIKILVHCALHV